MATLDNGITMMFFNICWHRLYEGPRLDDKTDSRHGYFTHDGNEWGEECYTFLPDNGNFYFHGPTDEDKTIRLENLGANNTDILIDDILTVFISTEPISGRQYIVGWYKNARVFREFQEYHDPERRSQTGGPWFYNVLTDEKYGVRVEAKHRNKYILPESIKFRATFFANGSKNLNFCKEVYAYICNCEQEIEADKEKLKVKVRRSAGAPTVLYDNSGEFPMELAAGGNNV